MFNIFLNKDVQRRLRSFMQTFDSIEKLSICLILLVSVNRTFADSNQRAWTTMEIFYLNKYNLIARSSSACTIS
jgi:hypothetical protein